MEVATQHVAPGETGCFSPPLFLCWSLWVFPPPPLFGSCQPVAHVSHPRPQTNRSAKSPPNLKMHRLCRRALSLAQPMPPAVFYSLAYWSLHPQLHCKAVNWQTTQQCRSFLESRSFFHAQQYSTSTGGETRCKHCFITFATPGKKR